MHRLVSSVAIVLLSTGLASAQAVYSIRTHGIVPAPREAIVSCGPFQSTGIDLADDGESVVLQDTHLVVQNCTVGLALHGRPGVPITVHGVTLEPSTATEAPQLFGAQVTAQVFQIGIWLLGGGSLVTDNIVGGADDGILVGGSGNTLQRNHSNGNRRDGILVVGHENLLEGNETRNNGAVGIHLTDRRIQQTTTFNIPYPELPDQNIIRGNTSLGNKARDLHDMNPDCPADPTERRNFWEANIFATKNQACFN